MTAGFVTVQPGRAGTARATAAYSDVGSVGTLGDASYKADRVMNVDPLFVDPERQDRRLCQGSPTVDVGQPNPAYDDRPHPPAPGAERNDMGAYGGPGKGDWL